MSTPEPGINLDVVYARSDHARRIIAACTAAMPAVAVMWEQVDHALADAPVLGAVIARLTSIPGRRYGACDRWASCLSQVRSCWQAGMFPPTLAMTSMSLPELTASN